MLKSTFLCLQLSLLSVVTFGQHQSTSTLFYYSDCSIAPTDQKQMLQSNLQKIGVDNIRSIQIKGYCDDVGTAEHSDSLSQERAENMKYYLSKLGVVEDLVERSAGMGEIALDPESPKSIEEQRSFNRRVDIEITYVKVQPQVERKVLRTASKPKTLNLATKPNEPFIADSAQVGDIIRLKNILFVGGLDIFLEESYDELHELLMFMRKNETVEIRILGHVCCTAKSTPKSDEYDRKQELLGRTELSKLRAIAVYNFLLEYGIDEDRLSYKGLKGDFPLGGPVMYDRRVEIEILNR